MRAASAALLTVSLALAIRVPRAAADAGICARCHETEAALATHAGGHATLACETCHEDRRPGSVGPGHRAIPTSCTSHHATAPATHPPPARALGPARLRRTCLACHDVHGSDNAHLVRTAIRVRHRFRPIRFTDAGGAVAGGFVDPAAPGRGLCEVCHRTTKFYRADGRGQPHFAADCRLCHDHAASFAPVITDASCPVCHADEAARLAKPSLHDARFAGRCSSCHAPVTDAPGPGHRAIAACASCHPATSFATHAPPGEVLSCAQCHDPHGSDQLSLVRDVVTDAGGGGHPIAFRSRDGRADDSFASASAPGTGLCEVCHTTTQFYRRDGTGAAHFVVPCTRCHPHAAGFAPR